MVELLAFRYSTRGRRPGTTISRPSHNLLIFSSEPPRNARPSRITFFKFATLKDNFFILAKLKIWCYLSLKAVYFFARGQIFEKKDLRIGQFKYVLKEEREFQGGSDEKIRRMWLGRETVMSGLSQQQWIVSILSTVKSTHLVEHLEKETRENRKYFHKC